MAQKAEKGLEAESDKSQLDLAREAKNTWTFQDKEYELFLVNGEGGVRIQILDPNTQEPLAIVGAKFAWEKSKPFIDHLDYGFREVIDANTGLSVPKADNIIIRNSKLFRELLQSGDMTEINEFGEHQPTVEMTRAELLELLPQEYQSDLLDAWLSNFHITRYFPPNTSRLNSILKSDTLSFLCKIGDVDEPRHVLLFEFQKPSKDARRDYEDKAAIREREQKGNETINNLVIDNEYKWRFIRKHFLRVQGVAVGEVGVPFSENNDDIISQFRMKFNPHWWIALSDQLAQSFANTGKR